MCGDLILREIAVRRKCACDRCAADCGSGFGEKVSGHGGKKVEIRCT